MSSSSGRRSREQSAGSATDLHVAQAKPCQLEIHLERAQEAVKVGAPAVREYLVRLEVLVFVLAVAAALSGALFVRARFSLESLSIGEDVPGNPLRHGYVFVRARRETRKSGASATADAGESVYVTHGKYVSQTVHDDTQKRILRLHLFCFGCA